MDAIDIDPLLLSRELQRANDLREAWESSLTAEDAIAAAFPASRTLLGQERVEGVLARPADDPMRLPLLRWLHMLTERRVNQGFYARTAELRSQTLIGLSEPKKGLFSLQTMLREALRTEGLRPAWLKAFTEPAAPLSEATSLHWQRKAELGRRLKLDVEALVLPHAEVVSIAEDCLVRSKDLAREFPTPELATYVTVALGREAHQGLPSRLNTHMLSDWFRDGALLQGLEPRPPELPEPLGASSFGRALWSFGAALRVAAEPSHQPFVIARDPYGLEAHGWGALFASLLLQQSFLTRKLGLGLAAVKDFRRVTTRLCLFELRWLAFKLTLRPLAQGLQSRLLAQFPELSHERLGVDLSPRLALVLPRIADDDAQRFVALATVQSKLLTLEEDHNEDWFRNPRAIDQLRSDAQLSPVTVADGDALRAGLTATLARLSKTLGS